MKNLIIYNSEYCAAQQYANWLGGELGIAVVTSYELTDEHLDQIDFLIISMTIAQKVS